MIRREDKNMFVIEWFNKEKLDSLKILFEHIDYVIYNDNTMYYKENEQFYNILLNRNIKNIVEIYAKSYMSVGVCDDLIKVKLNNGYVSCFDDCAIEIDWFNESTKYFIVRDKLVTSKEFYNKSSRFRRLQKLQTILK
jgi:hypothetical protein